MSVTDYSKLGKPELIRALKQRDAERRFGLVWERDDIKREQALNDDFVALDLVTKHSEGIAPYYNALIEGDNLDALRNLAVPLAGAVKCIYIDPPYNTGSQDFIYNDRFMKAEDRYRHSTWLEFMYRRLTVAKTLLAPDGAIFVSIGEDEQARLALMMEEIFGSSSKVGTFIWRRRSGAHHEKRWNISADHEYVLCYANSEFTFAGEVKKFEEYKNPDKDSRGDWTRGDLTAGVNYKQRPNNFYPLHNETNDVWYPCNPDACWRFGMKERMNDSPRGMTMNERIQDGRVLWPTQDKTVVYESEDELLAAIRHGDAPGNLGFYALLNRIYAEIDRGEAPKKLREYIQPLSFWVGKKIGFGSPQSKRFRQDVRQSEKPVSTWFAPSSIKSSELESLDLDEVETLSCGYTQEGTKLVSEMLGNRDFKFPKPLSLVKALVRSATSPYSGDIVLDFFAGSGTTGHAVMKLNEDDNGGNRRFILVSSTESTESEPRKNVCHDIARRRLSAAINGYKYSTKKQGKKSVAPLGGNFAYFRTARIESGRVRDEIRHSQVWISLQMMHFPNVVPWEKGAKWAWHESESERIIYLAEADSATVKKAAKFSAKKCVVYTWQPGAVAGIFRGVEVERIPEFILRRYGMEDK